MAKLKTTNIMGKVYINQLPMEPMKANGQLAKVLGMEYLWMSLVIVIRGCITMIKRMVKAYNNMRMGKNMKAIS